MERSGERAGHAALRRRHMGGTAHFAVRGRLPLRDDHVLFSLCARPPVVFAFDGFYKPVDNLPVVNFVMAGRAIR